MFTTNQQKMCLTTRKSYKELPAQTDLPITKKEVIVYKGLDSLCTKKDKSGKRVTIAYSPHRAMKYIKGYHYTEKTLRYNTGAGGYLNFNQGLHACTSAKKARTHGVHVVQMIIPAGSILVHGSRQDVVTNNLIWY